MSVCRIVVRTREARPSLQAPSRSAECRLDARRHEVERALDRVDAAALQPVRHGLERLLQAGHVLELSRGDHLREELRVVRDPFHWPHHQAAANEAGGGAVRTHAAPREREREGVAGSTQTRGAAAVARTKCTSARGWRQAEGAEKEKVALWASARAEHVRVLERASSYRREMARRRRKARRSKWGATMARVCAYPSRPTSGSASIGKSFIMPPSQ
eukprot:5713513-Pleurochrysis_carterae.AAC.2